MLKTSTVYKNNEKHIFFRNNFVTNNKHTNVNMFCVIKIIENPLRFFMKIKKI